MGVKCHVVTRCDQAIPRCSLARSSRENIGMFRVATQYYVQCSTTDIDPVNYPVRALTIAWPMLTGYIPLRAFEREDLAFD